MCTYIRLIDLWDNGLYFGGGNGFNCGGGGFGRARLAILVDVFFAAILVDAFFTASFVDTFLTASFAATLWDVILAAAVL